MQRNAQLINAAAGLLQTDYPGLTAEHLQTALQNFLQTPEGVRQHERPLTFQEAADFLNVSRITIFRMCQDGRLKGVRLGDHSPRVLPESVRALLNRSNVEA